MSADPRFRRRDAVVTPHVPYYHLVILLGVIASATAITAILFDDRMSAALASAALLGVAGWIVLPLLQAQRR